MTTVRVKQSGAPHVPPLRHSNGCGDMVTPVAFVELSGWSPQSCSCRFGTSRGLFAVDIKRLVLELGISSLHLLRSALAIVFCRDSNPRLCVQRWHFHSPSAKRLSKTHFESKVKRTYKFPIEEKPRETAQPWHGRLVLQHSLVHSSLVSVRTMQCWPVQAVKERLRT